MTDPEAPDDPDGLPASRRDLLKGAFFGGIMGSGSRLEAAKALLLGQSAVTGSEDGSRSAEFPSATDSSWNPIPVRATENVSVRDIVKNTSNVNGPPYRLTDVAKQRGLLDSPHPDNPREEPPFALRELITSQAISSNKTDRSSSGWTNWVGDWGSENDLTEFKPENKRELVEAIIETARAEEKIRAVGAGHSHSKVAVPDKNFIRLSWYDNGVKGLVKKRDRAPGVRSPPSKNPRVRVEAGAPIRYLARKLLLDEGLALQNRGSFDAQTLAGAINTSTHGTGAGLGALSDSVRSVEIATVVESPAQEGKPLVRLFRVEPENGLTDRRGFEREVGTHETTLIQDDDVFHSVVVGYGCMGVAYSYTIDVRKRYWLYESNVNTKWSKFKNNIDTLLKPPSEHQSFYNSHPRDFDPTDSGEEGSRHFQFLLNLSMSQVNTKSDPRCLVISHREPHKYTKPPSWDRYPELPRSVGSWPRDKNWPPERTGKGLIRSIVENSSSPSFDPKDKPFVSSPGINKYFQTTANSNPSKTSKKGTSFETEPSKAGAKHIPDGYWSASFVALKRPKEHDPDPPWDEGPKEPPLAISTEIAVPADQVVKAVEAVMKRAENHRLTFHAPMGVRFVARSEHFLAPEYQGENDPKGPVAKVEVPFTVEKYKSVSRNSGGQRLDTIPKEDMLDFAKEGLGAIEDKLITMSENGELGEHGFARPHMGKTNNIGVTDDGKIELRKHYEKFDTWQAVHEAFDPFGTFNNGFTESKGISIERD